MLNLSLADVTQRHRGFSLGESSSLLGGLIIISCLFINPMDTYACGGFFCNASQPVNQAAERILFASQDGEIEMHVQIQYQGPPTGFGWILPVSPGVETEVSSEALFIALDRIYGPQFFLRYEYGDGCEFPVNEFDDEGGWEGRM